MTLFVPKVELPTNRYFENSQSLGNFDFQKIGKYPNLWEISIPNDSQKFSHFFDSVPVRGCVFAFFHWNVAFLFICINPSIVNHDDGGVRRQFGRYGCGGTETGTLHMKKSEKVRN
jgi:hypothetical protein